MPDQNTKHKIRLPSIGLVVVRIAAIVGSVELLIMVGLESFGKGLSENVASMLDPVALIVLTSPLIYFWVVRPFAQAHAMALDKIHHLACHDELTALPNRRQLQNIIKERLAESARHKEASALIFIDLDGFKLINDTHGHDAGDCILQVMANRLRSHVRREDAVSRIGGDEFIVLVSRLPGERLEAAKVACLVAAKIINEIRKPVEFHDRILVVGASVGIRVSLDEDMEVDTFMHDADQAMYQAKKEKPNKVWMHAAKDEVAREVVVH